MHNLYRTGLTTAAALGLILAGTAHAAGGQYQSGQQTGMDQQTQQSMDHQAMDQQAATGQTSVDVSKLVKASSLKDLEVRNNQGQQLGSIQEILIDQDGKVSHVVISSGGVLGVGEEQFLVPWDRVNIDDQQNIASIDIDQDQLSAEFSAFEQQQGTRLEQQDQQLQQDQEMQQDETGVQMDETSPGSEME